VVATSIVVGAGAARQFVIDRVTHALPIDASQVAQLIDRAVAARGSVTIIGVVLLLWSALGVFGALSSGISRVFIKAPRRPFWRERLLGLLLLAVTGLMAVASVGLGLVTQVAQDAVNATVRFPGASVLFAVLAFLIPVGLVFFAFLIVYRVVPNRPVETAEVWPGALLATVLWTGLRIGFTFYATRIAKYDTVFGPIGTGISLLVFLYFSSVVLLLGGELARANLREVEAERRPPGGPASPAEPATPSAG
jgi:membrane protein